MRIGYLSAPTGTFVTRVFSSVYIGDDRLGGAPFWAATDATLTPIFAVPFGANSPELPPPAPTPPSEASVVLPASGRISTRTCRRTTAAAGAAQPAVRHGFGPTEEQRLPSFRIDPPPSVPRPRPPICSIADHASLPSDCSLPSRRGTYISHARTFMLVARNEHLHPLVAAPFPEVPSAEYTAIDGSLVRHLDSPPSATRHCGQRGLCFGHCRSRAGVTPTS